MLLWVILGVLAIGVLGLACGWVLRGRSGLDAMYQTDLDYAARVEQDAQLNAMHNRNAHRGGSI